MSALRPVQGDLPLELFRQKPVTLHLFPHVPTQEIVEHPDVRRLYLGEEFSL